MKKVDVQMGEEFMQMVQINNQLEEENHQLRSLLQINYKDADQLNQDQQLSEQEIQFHDNFCISRKDLEKKVQSQIEVALEERKKNL